MGLGMPTGGYTGGGQKPVEPYRGSAPPPLSAQQQAALGWLQGASGMNLSQYNQQMSALGAQRSAAYAAAGAASAAAGRNYGLTIRGIDQDLMYGNQLREQEQYRNVDLGRERSNLDLWNANGIWNTTMTDLNRQRDFAWRNMWLNHIGDIYQYESGMRGVGSDAIARGARTAAGTLGAFGDVRKQRDLGLDRNQLGYDEASNRIDVEWWRGSQANTLANAQHGIDMKTFDSIARTYGIQAAQAAAQAALAKDRAASDRAGASGAANAQRNAALAGLAGQQSSAYGNYMQNQMGLMQQLLAFQ